MSRESKIIEVENKRDSKDLIREYEAFGWELLSINDKEIAFTRETQNKVYADLIKFEYQYEALREDLYQLKKPIAPKKINASTAFILILLLIIPGILYIVVKTKQNKKYKEELAAYEAEYDRIKKQIKKVCDDSRGVFFGQQNQ